MNDLVALLDRHKNLKFPEFPGNDDLADWMSELAEADGYYVGLVTSLINGERVRPINPQDLQDMRRRLEGIPGLLDEDRIIYEKCEKYLESLEFIASKINEAIK